MSDATVLTEDEALELLAFLVTAARTQVSAVAGNLVTHFGLERGNVSATPCSKPSARDGSCTRSDSVPAL